MLEESAEQRKVILGEPRRSRGRSNSSARGCFLGQAGVQSRKVSLGLTPFGSRALGSRTALCNLRIESLTLLDQVIEHFCAAAAAFVHIST